MIIYYAFWFTIETSLCIISIKLLFDTAIQLIKHLFYHFYTDEIVPQRLNITNMSISMYYVTPICKCRRKKSLLVKS